MRRSVGSSRPRVGFAPEPPVGATRELLLYVLLASSSFESANITTLPEFALKIRPHGQTLLPALVRSSGAKAVCADHDDDAQPPASSRPPSARCLCGVVVPPYCPCGDPIKLISSVRSKPNRRSLVNAHTHLGDPPVSDNMPGDPLPVDVAQHNANISDCHVGLA